MSFNHLKNVYNSVQRNYIEVTVGTDDGDFVGTDHMVIQAAVEYVGACGGGRVVLKPGIYSMGNAVYMKTGVALAGFGGDTILRRIPSTSSPLKTDIDWYDWQVELEDASGFRVGGGLMLTSLEETAKTPQATVHTIIGIDGNVLYLDSQPRMNHWLGLEAKASSISSIIRADYSENWSIHNLVLDGNREHNEYLNGNYGGAIFIQDCQHVSIKNVQIRDFNGDGMSWQVCHDVSVEDCCISNCAMLGLHPGSGSQRPVIRRNTVDKCDTGIFWCWGVKNGLAEENTISNCRIGISTGHRDTDNLMHHNRILDTQDTAILFRPERSPDRTSHRTVIEDSHIENASVGIHLSRGLEDVILRRNTISSKDGRMSVGILKEPGVERLILDCNTFDGVKEEVQELRSK